MKKALALICVATFAVNAHAGVKEKKAQRAAEENIAAAIVDTKAACGNAQLDVKVAWDEVDAMAADNEAIIQQKGMTLPQIYDGLGKRTQATLESLTKICQDDADYKAAIAEMTNVEVKTKPKYDDYRSAFTLNGTTLVIENGWYMTRSASDFRSRLMDLY
ncbi:hypothetical protein [Marinobacterium marinum]|uniref:Lipoprotein n=1 Tax=Marinobacterium marinum TaxID=2756129 RepID=A0A7W1WX92_9GAMM|nr:hypothetical protein [Marinobacterium marinum]MBA4501814.1 hypothetical protein [Marinobacterium marinum]